MMKKTISILAVLLLCVSLAVSVFATENAVPSVTNPLAPEIVPITDPDGNTAAGVIVFDDEIIDYVYYNPCLIVTPVYNAEDSEDIPEDAKEQLLDIYEKLQSGEMELPYDKLDADELDILDLFDITFLCEEHPEMLEQDGYGFQITFDLDVEEGRKVYAMTYADGEWNPIISTVNNDDGTVTCVFGETGPVVFLVETEESTDPTEPSGKPNDPVTPPEQTGDRSGEQIMMWASIALISLLAVAVLTVYYVRNTKKEN